MANVTFANPARDQNKVSAFTLHVLDNILSDADILSATITSTARTASDQARVMYENISRHGVAHQKKLYSKAGDQVIDVYAHESKAGKSADVIIGEMTTKILSLDPRKVSSHAADLDKLNVVDLAPSSIAVGLRPAFVKAVKAQIKLGNVTGFFQPPKDPAYHLEIPQPAIGEQE
jgi:hypothetical protein